MSKSLVRLEIAELIHMIRGKRVMLDADLAELYAVETGQLNRAVKRNSERFPEDFKFSAVGSGVYRLEMPIWHFKFMGWEENPSPCLLRAGCGDAVQRAEE